MSTKNHLPLSVVALLAVGGCSFDLGGPNSLLGQMDSTPPMLDGGGDLRVDGQQSDGSPDVGDGPVQPPDTTDDIASPDQLVPDSTADSVPAGCLSCGVLGCNVPLGRCNRLAPSNVPAALVATLHDDNLLGDCVLYSSSEPPASGERGSFGGCRPQGSEGSTRGDVYWDTITLSNGESATLFAMNSLVVQGNVTLRGEGPHPIIVYAREGITLRGLVDVSALSELAGPGGKLGGEFDGADGALCDGGQGRGGDLLTIDTDKSGGGGAGWGQPGAAGGTAGSILGGAGGTLPIATTSRALVPLRGGCGGGAGGGSSRDGGFGGGGGGAIQFSAGTLLIVDGEGIRASGGGGGGGHDMDAGGGGGSGGSILLESVEVRVTNTTPLSANGGGGGAGALPGEVGDFGDDGEHSTLSAAGGAGDAPAGSGGRGGAKAVAPTLGQDSTHSGGGGGGAGRIHVRARVGVMQSQAISPQHTSDPAPSVW